jgi:hypothetical protein
MVIFFPLPELIFRLCASRMLGYKVARRKEFGMLWNSGSQSGRYRPPWESVGLPRWALMGTIGGRERCHHKGALVDK